MIIDGYARISVDLQEENQENTSIENQKRIIKDYVTENFADAELKLYEDRDRSGYTFSQREHYQQMRKELMSGEVKILIVKDFSRFSRRNSLGLLELETLRDSGVRIISIGDNIDYPTKDDWMLIQFKFLMNEMPVTDTSKKIKHIIANRQKSGEWICAVPYGYRLINTKEMIYEIDPPAAEVVREVFRLYNNGWGYKKIANRLTETGVPTPRANEIAHKEAEGKTTKLKSRNEWSIISVSSIIQNDFYIGTLRQKKYTRKGINGKDVRVDDENQIVIENAHDPIVDIKTFTYAKEQLNLRSKSNYRGEKKYATDYSGFLYCGDCGSPMFSVSRPDLAAAYTCGTYHRRGLKGCTSHHIRVNLLDELLKNYVLRVRDNCGMMIAQLEQAIKEQPRREEELGLTVDGIERQITDAKDRLKELYKQKVLSTLGKTDEKARIREQVYEEMETELTERIVGLEKQFAEVSDMRNTMIQTNRNAKTVIDVFTDMLCKQTLDKRDIGLIVERITVYEDHIDVRLKADIDLLLCLEDKEETVNFRVDSKGIVKDRTVRSGTDRRDKVFTVNVISSGDCLQMRLDEYGCTVDQGLTPTTTRDGNYSSDFQEFAFALGDDGECYSYCWAGIMQGMSLGSSNGKYTASNDGTNTTYELYIPWDDITTEAPHVGTTHGYAIALLTATDGDYENWLEWGTGVINGRDDNVKGTNRLTYVKDTVFGGKELTDPNPVSEVTTKAPITDATGPYATVDITKLSNPNAMEYTVNDDGSVTFKFAEGNDPFITLAANSTAKIDGETYPYFAMYLKNNDAAISGEMFFATSESVSDFTGGYSVGFEYQEVTGGQIVVVDFTESFDFIGQVTKLRFDAYDGGADDYETAEITLYAAAFFKTIEEAYAFAVEGVTLDLDPNYQGYEAPPVITTSPETKAPETTPVTEPVNTQAPVTEDTSAKDSETKAPEKPAEKNNSWIIWVIVGVVAVAAVVVVVIIITKKKK